MKNIWRAEIIGPTKRVLCSSLVKTEICLFVSLFIIFSFWFNFYWYLTKFLLLKLFPQFFTSHAWNISSNVCQECMIYYDYTSEKRCSTLIICFDTSTLIQVVSYIPGTFLFVSLKIYYFAFTRIRQITANSSPWFLILVRRNVRHKFQLRVVRPDTREFLISEPASGNKWNQSTRCATCATA